MVELNLSGISYVAVIVAGIVGWIIGGIWYARPVFGRRWLALSGVSEEQARKGAAGAFVAALILSIVVAFFLAIVVGLMGATTVVDGAIAGFLVWLGFLATAGASSVMFERRPAAQYGINTGYQAVHLVVMGIILAVL